MFINLAKNDAGEGQNTDTHACGPNLASIPPRVGTKGILSYECMPPNRGSPSKVQSSNRPHTLTLSLGGPERNISPRWIVKWTKNNPPWLYNLSLVVGQSDGHPCDPGDGLARQ